MDADSPFGKYWWIFAILSAVVAVGLVLWRMPSIRARLAGPKKPAPKKRRPEPESEYETDSDDGELGEERLLAHLKETGAAREEERAPEAAAPAPKKRGRKSLSAALAASRGCTE